MRVCTCVWRVRERERERARYCNTQLFKRVLPIVLRMGSHCTVRICACLQSTGNTLLYYSFEESHDVLKEGNTNALVFEKS